MNGLRNGTFTISGREGFFGSERVFASQEC